MRKSRFTEEQNVAALKEHEVGASRKELSRRLGIATETLYNKMFTKAGYTSRQFAEATFSHNGCGSLH
ncbi:MAG: transposase [Dehalococcoidia bacterium]|nr:transposase [Dehalococcoidia bacterium]